MIATAELVEASQKREQAADLKPIVASLEVVSKNYGAIRALRGVDFEVHAGEVVALLGPNGAGKTTAIKLLLGLIQPNSGRVRIFGGDPTNPENRMRTGAMLQVGRVPETLRVREHINLFSSYYPKPMGFEEALAAGGLEKLRDRKFGDLSGGQRQRTLFALAICGDPDLLFLDEPTVGLDVEARRTLWDEIRRLVQRGKTVLLTTHYLQEADALADRIAVINQGEIIAQGTPAQIKAQTSGKRIRCITSLSVANVLKIHGVTDARQDREGIEIHARDAEPVVRDLLARDSSLSALEITSAGLEEAFLALTQDNGENAIARSDFASSLAPRPSWKRNEANIMSTAAAVLRNTRIERSTRHAATIYLKEAKYEFLKNLRLRVYTASVISFPLMFYVLFGLVLNAKESIGGTQVPTYLIATYGTFGVMGASLFGTASGLASDRGLGWLQVKRASPMPPFAYFVAKVVLSMIFSAIVVSPLLVLGVSFGGVRMPLAEMAKLFGTLVAGSLPFSAMGLAIGYFAGPNSAPAAINLIYLPLSFCSGLWVPYMFLPKLVRQIALALPPYHLSQLALGTVGAGGGQSRATHWEVLFAFTLICLGVARIGFQRDQGKLYG